MKKLALFLTRFVLKVIYRVEVINPEKVPLEGPALLCSTHNTLIDMFFLCYKIKRWVYWMAKDELFRIPIIGFLIRKLGAFPVKRGTADIASVKTAYRLLQEGKIVGIFPQGRRVKAGSEYSVKIKSGAAAMAINSEALIIPAVVQGSYKLFSKIRVKYGDPFRLNSDKGRKYSKEEIAAFSDEIMERIRLLMEV